MNNNIAIIIAGALIASAILITNHWQLVASANEVARLDRWTGEVGSCKYSGVVPKVVVVCQ